MNRFHRKCLVCDSDKIVHKYIINGFHILKCKSCSLMFVGEMLSQEQLTVHQNQGDDEFIYSDPDNFDNLKYYYGNLAEHISKKMPTGRVLDIGCSGGVFLDCMKGWECHGIEMDERYATIAKSKYGNHIFAGTLEDYQCAEEYFDVITLQDVLDHMLDPLQALTKCKSMIKPGGFIIIKVHNLSCLYAKLSGKRFYAFVPPIHLIYFNVKNLFLAIEKSGFEVNEYKFMPHLLSIKTIMFRLSHSGKRIFYSKLFKLTEKSLLGNVKIKKNLHDVVTVFARKK